MSNLHSKIVLLSLPLLIFFGVQKVNAQQSPPGNTTPACKSLVHDSDCGFSGDHGSRTCDCVGGGTTSIPMWQTFAGNIQICSAAVGAGKEECENGATIICETRVDYVCGGFNGCDAQAMGDPYDTKNCCPTALLSGKDCDTDAQ